MAFSEHAYNLWRARRTTIQMCHDRGYLVVQEELDLSFENFLAIYGENPSRSDMTIAVAHTVDTNEQMLVFFSDDEKISVKSIENYCRKLYDENINHAILVTSTVLTPAARQALVDLAPKYLIEHFMEAELYVNITEHELVPEHVIVSNDEKKTVLSQYRVKEHQLPRILTTDPVVRYLGARKGQILKITRPSETAGTYVTYRIVF